jgi:hypothetical protein
MLFGCSHCSFALLIVFLLNATIGSPLKISARVDTLLKTGEYPMRFVLIAALALSVRRHGCTWSMNHHLNNAYSAYDRGNCEQVMLELSKVERDSRARMCGRKCR